MGALLKSDFPKVILLFIALGGGLAVDGQRRGQGPPEVVRSVDLSRYAGKWYEIARLPNRFERKCAGEVTATYSNLQNHRFTVVNGCRLVDGRVYRAEGRAKVAKVDGPTSKLRVRFAPSWLAWLPMVWGDYWVFELAPDYSYAVVGSPDRRYLWVLSRSSQMDDDLYRRLVEGMNSNGFGTSRLIRTRQNI